MQQIYTMNMAAKKAGVSAYTISRMIKKGKIKASRLGHVWMIPEDQIELIRKTINWGRSRSGRIGGKARWKTVPTLQEINERLKRIESLLAGTQPN